MLTPIVWTLEMKTDRFRFIDVFIRYYNSESGGMESAAAWGTVGECHLLVAVELDVEYQ